MGGIKKNIPKKNSNFFSVFSAFGYFIIVMGGSINSINH